MRLQLAVLVVLLVILGGCVKPPKSDSNSTTSATTGMVSSTTSTSSTPATSSSTTTTGTTSGSTTSVTTSSTTTGTTAAVVLRVHYVNVGQGDGIIWELPGGGIVVYDCGIPASNSATNPMTTYLSTVLNQAPGSHIHALISSHGHLDHVGGCQEILQDYVVDHVYDTWYLNTNSDEPQSYAAFKAQVRSEGAVVHNLADDPALGTDVRFQQWDMIPLPAAGVQAQILWPAAPASSWSRIAEASLVVRLSMGGVDFCFQGDIETAQETVLKNDAHAFDCEVYLMGHHGSRYASSTDWLAKLDPEYAPVSFGTNSYGHPTSEALCRVQAAGAAVYATERLGSIVIQTDGTQIQITPNTPETVNYCAAGANYWSGSSSSSSPPTTPPPLEILTVVNPSTALDEYVEIRNNGLHVANLENYAVHDAAGTTYTFPAYTLAAGASVRIHTGTGTASATDLYWGRGSAVWNNSGDTAYLRDPTGSLLDDYTY